MEVVPWPTAKERLLTYTNCVAGYCFNAITGGFAYTSYPSQFTQYPLEWTCWLTTPCRTQTFEDGVGKEFCDDAEHQCLVLEWDPAATSSLATYPVITNAPSKYLTTDPARTPQKNWRYVHKTLAPFGAIEMDLLGYNARKEGSTADEFSPKIQHQLPGPWYITSTRPDAKCPTPGAVLITFAVMNALTALVSVIVGHRAFAHKVTFGKMGKGEFSRTYKWKWIGPCVHHFVANAAVVGLVTHTTGYLNQFAFADLVLLYSARPRFAWLFLLPLAAKYKGDFHPRDNPWLTSALSKTISEPILLLVSLYPIGKVVRFGVTSGFYMLSGASYDNMWRAAHIMYAGALMYLICASLFTMFIPMGLYMLVRASNLDDIVHLVRAAWAVNQILLLLVWVGAWLFWVGYVALVGD